MRPTTIGEMGFSRPATLEKLAAAGIRDLVDLATYSEARLRTEVRLSTPEIVEVKEVVIGADLVPGMSREQALAALAARDGG